MNNANSNAGTFEFKAEMKQLLKLIINSLYTNPEVFLRELVSNSSDALNKVRFEKLTKQNILQPDEELKITINTDPKNHTFSIEDNGIGMTKDDLINKLGTVASSGTAEFLKKYKESNKKLDAGLIGQFGVGFYSAFMVTDEITVETRSAFDGSEAYIWKSNGEDSFTVEPSDRKGKGTKISFTLKDEYKDLAEEYRIKSILQKYSNFVDFPIFIGEEKVNTVTAIWQKKKNEIKDEELNEFYKFVSNDYQDPLGSLHLQIEGNVNFKALLFIPKFAPPNMYNEELKTTLHLYSNNVFIQDDAKGLLPDYLNFVKGVVDTEDLPLNVSREVTQNSPLMAKIKDILTKRILGLLEEWSEKETDKFNTFYEEFAPLFKTGINSDFNNKDRIVELLRFNSNKTKDDEMTSLNGYVSRMKPEQKEIYYVSGTSTEQIEKNPNLEYFIKNDIEVLFLTDPVDSFTVPYLGEYDKKPLKSIEKADIEVDKDKKNDNEELKNMSESIIKLFKDTLGDKVEDVKESNRLIDSAATLVVGKEGMDPHMEKMMKMMDKNFQSAKKILEINMSHPLLKNISSMVLANKDETLIKDVINQIYEGTLLIEGQLSSPNDFVKRMNELLVRATK